MRRAVSSSLVVGRSAQRVPCRRCRVDQRRRPRVGGTRSAARTCRPSTRRSSTGSVRPPRRSARATVASSTAPNPARRSRRSADGRVTFAGSVAGTLHVTVLHDDGVRTTYSFLQRVDVVIGQAVAPGRPGRAERRPPAPRRRGAATATSIRRRCSARRCRRCTSCPSTSLPATASAGERSAIGQLIDGAGRLLDGASGAAGAVGTWLRDGGSQLLRTVDHYAASLHLPVGVRRQLVHHPPGLAARPIGRRPTLHRRRAIRCHHRPIAASPCSSPASDRTARGSTVDQVHTEELGYASPDVLRFSYAGGRVPDPTDRLLVDPGVRLRRPRDPGRTSGPRAAGSPTWSSRSPPALRACRST